MSFITDQLRANLDCRVIAERYNVRFRRRSTGWWLAHCFNSEVHTRGDRNPSLSISAQGYKCFSANCAISGDVFSLIAHFNGLDPRQHFEQILKIASEFAGMDHDLLRLEADFRFSQHVAQRPRSSNWRLDKKKRERAERQQVIDRLKNGGSSAHHALSQPPAPRPAAPQAPDQRKAIFDFMVRTLDPNTPPPLTDHFPDPFDDPFSIDPRHPRLEIMQRIWALVAPLELTRGAETWLQSRGISPAIAHAYGCRDWTPVKSALKRSLDDFSPQELEDAGLTRRQDEKLKIWTGLRALDGEHWAQGLGVPLVHPGWPMAPIAWRWRLFEPFKTRDGKSFKAIAQYSGSPHIPSIPLGVTPLSSQALSDVARWPHLTPQPEAPRYVIVLSEGEPDWLSVAEVASQIDTEVYIVSVGLVAMSHGYPPSLAGLLEGAERILCVMDRGNTNKKWAKTGGQIVVDRLKGTLLFRGMERGEEFNACFDEVNRRVTSALQADDHDINDLHKRGALRPLIERRLGDLL